MNMQLIVTYGGVNPFKHIEIGLNYSDNYSVIPISVNISYIFTIVIIIVIIMIIIVIIIIIIIITFTVSKNCVIITQQ